MPYFKRLDSVRITVNYQIITKFVGTWQNSLSLAWTKCCTLMVGDMRFLPPRLGVSLHP